MEDKIKELGLLLGKANKLFEEIQNTPTNDPADSPNPQFEAGKWYTYGPNLINFKELNGNRGESFGFNKEGWFSGCKFQAIQYNYRPATPEEVKQALVKEAERRGFKEGCTIRNSFTVCGGDNYELGYNKKFNYCPINDRLTFGTPYVYQQGQWAEIIKEEVIKIGGETVVFGSGYIEIKGVVYNKMELEYLKKIMDKGQVQSLNTGCSGQHLFTLKELNSILNKLK